MKDFVGLNYYTIYSCKGDFNLELGGGGRSCFAEAYRAVSEGKKSIVYEIHIYKEFEKLEKHYSNSCFLNKKELKNYINTIREIAPFTYTINEDNDKFIITVNVEKQKGIVHKYILNAIRYTYEYPYCLFIKDAYRLRKEKEFLFESIFNLFNLVTATYGRCGGGHCVVSGPHLSFLTNRELKAKLNKVSRLNSLISNKKTCDRLPTLIKEYNHTDIEYWSEEFFEQRKGKYLESYKRIK